MRYFGLESHEADKTSAPESREEATFYVVTVTLVCNHSIF